MRDLPNGCHIRSAHYTGRKKPRLEQQPYGAGEMTMKIGKDGWLELDPQTDMNSDQRAAYEQMKTLYSHYKAARDEYERAMMALAPQGKTLVFGYNFGKASIKIVDAGERKARAQAKPSLSLRDFLDNMATSGRSA